MYLRREVWTHRTILTRHFLCQASVSTIRGLDVGPIPAMWYIFVFILKIMTLDCAL